MTGRRQRPPSDDGHDAMTEHLQGTEPLNLDARRMHIQVAARRFARELVRTHKGEADRMSDHPAPQETPSRGTQGMLGRATASESQLDRARVSTMAQGSQDCRLVFFARVPPDHEDANDSRLPRLAPIGTYPLAERHAVRQEQQGRSHTQLRHSFIHGARGTLNEVTAIEDRALPQLKDRPIERDNAIQVDRGRQVFGVNVIGRDDGHAPPARVARDDSLQVEGLLEMDDVRPGERTLYLAAPRAREGVAL